MTKDFFGNNVTVFSVLVLCIVVASGIFLYSVIKTNMINDTIQHETDLADTIIKSTRYAMLKDDRITLGNIISNIGERESVEHVRIFNKKGLIMFSSRSSEIHQLVDKKAAGCVVCHGGPVAATRMGRMEQARRFINERGKHVLAITAPIYNEPDCSSASCHFHSAGQKLLGTLDIGQSEELLQKSLSAMKRTIIFFCVINMFLIVGGVTLLFRRRGCN
jgi:hypothetical protein